MTQRTLNYLLAAAIAALLATAHLLDGPDDIQTARAIAADLADAQAQAHAKTQVQP